MSYSKGFVNPYPSGWEDLPSEETPVTAEALQAHTDAIEHIDDYLFNNQIESKADADIVANEFDIATTYNENDYFMYEGTLYKVLVTCQGVEPPDEDFYQPTLISDEFGSGGGSANIAYGTTEQFNAQKESAPVGTTFLITDDVGGSDGGIYDGEERVIGTWFGKPLYRKTITMSELGLGTTSVALPNDLKMITSFKGVLINKNDNKVMRVLPFSDNTNANNIRVDSDGTYLRVITYTDWSNYIPYVTIEYTKTTD